MVRVGHVWQIASAWQDAIAATRRGVRRGVSLGGPGVVASRRGAPGAGQMPSQSLDGNTAIDQFARFPRL